MKKYTIIYYLEEYFSRQEVEYKIEVNFLTKQLFQALEYYSQFKNITLPIDLIDNETGEIICTFSKGNLIYTNGTEFSNNPKEIFYLNQYCTIKDEEEY